MPLFRPDNTDYFVISDAAPALCSWILALHPMVHAARDINPVRETVGAFRATLKLKQGILWGEQEEYSKLERYAVDLRARHSAGLQGKHSVEEQLTEVRHDLESTRLVRELGVLRVPKE